MNWSTMVMQPACKSTMIAGKNLVLPRGLDLGRGQVETDETENGNGKLKRKTETEN